MKSYCRHEEVALSLQSWSCQWSDGKSTLPTHGVESFAKLGGRITSDDDNAADDDDDGIMSKAIVTFGANDIFDNHDDEHTAVFKFISSQ